jgi:predicted RNA methylase
MVKDYLLLKYVLIDYTRSADQIIEQAQKMIENMVTRKHLDLAYDFELLAEDIGHRRLLKILSLHPH